MESHFSQGFEMSLRSWSGGNRNHVLWVRRKAVLKQKNPFLGLMTLGKVSHFSVLFLEAVGGCLGYVFLYVTSSCEGGNHILSTERIVSVISKWLMSGAIKFSSRTPDR